MYKFYFREIILSLELVSSMRYWKLIQRFQQGDEVLEKAYSSNISKEVPDYRPKRSKRSKRKRAV